MSYVKENNGKNSSVRGIFIIGSFWNMAMVSMLAFWGEGVDVPSLIAFQSAVQGVLVGLKLGQKPMENKKDLENG